MCIVRECDPRPQRSSGKSAKFRLHFDSGRIIVVLELREGVFLLFFWSPLAVYMLVVHYTVPVCGQAGRVVHGAGLDVRGNTRNVAAAAAHRLRADDGRVRRRLEDQKLRRGCKLDRSGRGPQYCGNKLQRSKVRFCIRDSYLSLYSAQAQE